MTKRGRPRKEEQELKKRRGRPRKEERQEEGEQQQQTKKGRPRKDERDLKRRRREGMAAPVRVRGSVPFKKEGARVRVGGGRARMPVRGGVGAKKEGARVWARSGVAAKREGARVRARSGVAAKREGAWAQVHSRVATKKEGVRLRVHGGVAAKQEGARVQVGSDVGVEKEGCKKWERPNPLVGRAGEGAPIAPPGWRWKAGKRSRDMYFYAPSGLIFRSQTELQSYLVTLPEAQAPPLSLFRFKVEAEEFKDGKLPGAIDDGGRKYGSHKKKSREEDLIVSGKRRKLNSNSNEPLPRIKVKSHGEDKIISGKRRKPATILSGVPSQLKVKSHQEDLIVSNKKRKLTTKSNEPPPQFESNSNVIGKSNGDIMHSPQKNFHPEMNGSVDNYQREEKENDADVMSRKEIDHSKREESINSTFRSLVLGSTSYNLLSKNADVLQKFVDEAERLKEKEPREIDELRSQLLRKKLNHAQLSKYPESALHVFYYILRNEEAPAGFGKEELIEFCRKWSCKHKHCWCLLETSRFDISVEPSSLIPSKGQAQEECMTKLVEKSLKPGSKDNVDIVDENLIGTAKDLPLKAGENFTGRIQQNIGGLHVCRDSKEAKSGYRQLMADDRSKLLPEKCSCRVCLRDDSFCYGCTCSLCKVFIQHAQSWTYMKCPACQHFCHLECALKAMRGGVVPELGLDGEFLCPCCLKKSDMVPFWVDRLKDALSSIDRSAVQKYLTSAVLVLNGTRRPDFEEVHRSVTQLHDSLLYNTHCPNLQQILRQIQEKVDSFSTPLKDVLDTVVSQEQEKLLEGLKRAELDYADWLIAEKDVDVRRATLRDAQEEMKKAESDVSAKAVRAKASRFLIQNVEKLLQSMNQNSTLKALSQEQFEKQREALELGLAEMNRLQDKLGSLSSKPGGIATTQFSSLLRDFKVQTRRVENMKSRLEQMDCLNKFFS